MSKNYYVILGVASDASGDDIKSAFRRRAMELHPDTSGLESEPFLELQEAYGVLSDPRSRQHYDHNAHSIAMRRRPSGPVAEPLVRVRPRGEPFLPPASPRNIRQVSLWENFERESPKFQVLFDRLWRNFESLNQPKPESLESLTVEVVVSREEARFGGRVQVGSPARATCPACDGHGAVGFYECSRCEARGALVMDYPVAVVYPPGIRDGYTVRISLDRVGIENFYLTVLFRVSDGW
jgi:molecular chaperone DnaJ